MESTSLLLLVAAFITGAVISFLLTKLRWANQFVHLSDYDAAQKELHHLRSEKTYLDKHVVDLRCEKDKLTVDVNNRTDEISRLTGLVGVHTTDADNARQTIEQLKKELENAKQECTVKSNELIQIKEQLVQSGEELKQNKEKLEVQKEEIEKLGEKFEKAFKVLAQQILDDKTKKFSDEQEKNLKTLLEPLQVQIRQFKDDIEIKHRQESEERISLREQVKIITQTNQTLSEQANKLTETLRLQVKQQGDWGESILEAILENSGLQKGLQYFTQQSSRNSDGKTIRPDVVVKYPDQRSIIIDSKVSLVHYYNMCNATDEAQQKIFAKQLVQSFKNHIDELSGRNYTDLAQALDVVIMFVPVETAYIAAMHTEADLWQYAFRKNVLLISPANLIATLKLVKDMWRKDAVDRNAYEIAEKAGKLYDKLVLFIESFEKVGGQIEKAGQTWAEAKKQLTSGRGNLISQAQKMNALHDKGAKKCLPEELVNTAMVEDELPVKSNTSVFEGIGDQRKELLQLSARSEIEVEDNK